MNIVDHDFVRREYAEAVEFLPGLLVSISHPSLGGAPITGELIRQTNRTEWLICVPQAGPGVYLRIQQEYLQPLDG